MASLLVAQVYAGLPMVTYEAPTFQNGDSVAGLSGWSVLNGQATVVDGEGFDSSQALKLHKGSSQDVKVTRTISMAASETVSFVDFRIKPAAVPVTNATSTIVVNGSHLSFVRDAASGAGVLYALDGNDDSSSPSEWMDTSHRQALDGALSHQAQDWVRISIRQDYDLKEWDLYVDGVLCAAGMGFYQRGAVMDEIEFYGSKVADVFLDDLQADEENVLFTDADEDGIPDEYELANGMDITRNDRWDLNADGETFLDAYLTSIWPSYDSDGNTQQGAVAPAALSGSGSIPPITILGEHEVVGSVGGSFQVSGDGSGNYSVPIDLPAGTGGMVPKLALSYSSAGGAGLMGVGWDLSGLQRITRGPATKARDGFIDPVDFDENDRFYLDGERLVCNSGTYGADGAEYRTENNSFARIISHGVLGSGPAYWEVETKAGLKLTFGNCATSCVQNPSGDGALVWSINKVADSVSNYYSICYVQEGGAPGESIDYRPNQIRYTGNTDAAVAPYNLVKFVYEERPDVSSGYISGIKVHSSKRMKRVDISYDAGGSGSGALLYQYDLSYCDEDGVKYPNGWADFLKTSQTRRSLLHTITKKASDGTALPPTIINWGPAHHANPPIKWGASSKDEQNYPGWSGSDNDYSMFIDMNGDGLVDRVDHKDYDSGDFGLWVSLNDGATFANKSKWLDMSYENQNYPKWGSGSKIYSALMDMNADGLPDRVNHKNYTTGEFGIWVALNTGNGFGSFSKWMSSSKDEQNYIEWVSSGDTLSSFIDMNGDGLPDRVDHYNYTTNEFGIWVRLNNGAGFDSSVKWLDASFADRSAQAWGGAASKYNVMMDINGDGLPDRIEHKNYDTNDYGIWVQLNKGSVDLSTGTAFGPLTQWLDMPKDNQNKATWGSESNVLSMFIDINGDGLPDRANHKNYTTGESGLWICLNTGKGFEAPQKWLTSSDAGQTKPRWGSDNDVLSMFLDINADGLPDRVDHRINGSGGDRAIWVRLNTGSGFESPHKWLDSKDESQTWPIRVSGSSTKSMFIDINGDGLPDRVNHNDAESGESGLFVYLNTGNSFGATYHVKWASSTKTQQNYITWIDSGNIRSDYVDMNGDGLLDRVDHYNYETNEDGLWVSLNTGGGYASAEKWNEGTHSSQNYIMWNKDSHGSVYSCLKDMNGDGLPDKLDHKNYDTGDVGLWVSINTGSGFATWTKWLDMAKTEQNYPMWGSDSGNAYSDLVDVNGDGLPDRVDHYNYETDEDGLWIRLNTGTGFAAPALNPWMNSDKDDQNRPTWESGGDICSGFLDMNGDGLLDRVDHKNYTTGDYGISVRLNTGSAFASPVEWLDMSKSNQNYILWNDSTYGSIYSCFIDMNGDGLPDKVDHYDYTLNDYGLWVHLNTGSGFLPSKKWLDATSAEKSCPTRESSGDVITDLRDMNGDGLPDRVEHEHNGDYGIWVRLNNGSGFGSIFKWLDVIEDNPLDVKQNYISQNSGSNGSVYNDLVDVNGDGLLDHVMYYNYQTGEYGLWVELNEGDGFQISHDPTIQERISSITDGFGAEIKIEYMRTNDPTHVTNSSKPVYAKADLSTVPSGHIAVQDGRWVVSRYAEQNGLGGWRWKRHHYSDYRYDRINEVPLGFRTMEVIDEQRGQSSYTEYSQAFPFQGSMHYTESRLSDGTIVSKSQNTYAQKPVVQGVDAKIYYPYQSDATEWKYDVDGSSLSTSTVAQTMDDYGSLLTSVITLTEAGSSSNVWTTTTTNVYQNDTTKWHLARLLNASVTKTGTGQAPQTKSTAFTYNSTTGLLETETVEPGHAKSVTTSRSRDVFGNVNSTTTSASGIDQVDRVLATTHPDGTCDCGTYSGFTTVMVNRNGQTRTRLQNAREELVSVTDHTGNASTFEYFVNGKAKKATGPGGHTIENTYDLFGNKLTTLDSDTGLSSSTYDAFGQVLTVTDAKGQTTSFSYDIAGRPLTKVSPEETVTYTYDSAPGASLGKPATVTSTSGYSESFTYDVYGRSISVSRTINGETFTGQTWFDALGRVTVETDAGGLSLRHHYNALGFEEKITEAYTGVTYWEPVEYEKQKDTLKDKKH